MKLEEIVELICCPTCKRKVHLRRNSSQIVCQRFHRFPVVNGKPIMIRRPRDLHIQKPESSIISENISEFFVDASVSGLSATILHLGSGNVPCNDTRVISVDVVPADNVDLVCEAENLPFRDETFDCVVSGAVLEHVYDPIKSAKEIHRALKIGGRTHHTVAFMQPYHGFPSHYFNWTPVAMETYLLHGFDYEVSEVAENGTMGETLTQSWKLFLEQLDFATRERLLNLKLSDALRELSNDFSTGSDLANRVPKFTQEQLAAAYTISGVKCVKSITDSGFASRDMHFWQTRRIALLRIQEIELYKRLAESANASASDFNSIKNEFLSEIEEITKNRLKDLNLSIQSLLELNEILEAHRDTWIDRYLNPR